MTTNQQYNMLTPERNTSTPPPKSMSSPSQAGSMSPPTASGAGSVPIPLPRSVPLAPSPLSRAAAAWDSSPTTTSPTTPTRTPSNPHRRQSLSTSPSPNTLSLVGSYSESLLSGRMSTTPSRPFAFNADIGVLGQIQGQTPRHCSVDFEARYYADHQQRFTGSSSSLSSLSSAPYVGGIDIEAMYEAQLRQGLESGDPPAPPLFPGYQIPPRGQLQVLVKNPLLNAPVKLFLVPYDISDMPSGTKTFIRQKICVQTPPDNKLSRRRSLPHPSPTKETLKYAIHIHIIALSPDHLPTIKNSNKPPTTRYFIHKSVRLVFSPRAPDAEEIIKTYIDTPAGMMGRAEKYMPIHDSIASREWYVTRKQVLQLRREVKARKKSHTTLGEMSDLSISTSVGDTTEAVDIPPRTEDMTQSHNNDGCSCCDPESKKSFAPNSDPNGERWLSSTPAKTETAITAVRPRRSFTVSTTTPTPSPTRSTSPWSNLQLSRPPTPTSTALQRGRSKTLLAQTQMTSTNATGQLITSQGMTRSLTSHHHRTDSRPTQGMVRRKTYTEGL